MSYYSDPYFRSTISRRAVSALCRDWQRQTRRRAQVRSILLGIAAGIAATIFAIISNI